MSVSSGSDITIPIQDSPPPPPSPYAGTNGGPKAGKDDTPGGKSTPEPRGDVTVTVGFVNEAYQDHSPDQPPHSEKNGHKMMTNGQKKSSNGAISITVPGEIVSEKGGDVNQHQEIHLNEAVNPELINMNILNTIPDKPNPEYGPYDNMDEYFVPVNQHKKFLRSEKLYVTKDKRKESHWKKYVCWVLGASILAAIVTIAVLAGIGLIPQKSPNHFESVVGTTNAAETGDLSTGDGISTSSAESSLPSSTEINTPPSVPVDATYVPMAADIHFIITDLAYEPALNDKASDRFQELASKLQDNIKDLMKSRAGLETVFSRVTEFTPGSVVVKMRIGWLDQAMDFAKVRMVFSNVTTVGEHIINPISSYEIVNLCKFNKNGCSHNCSYSYIQLDFYCSCGDDRSLYLADDKKTCLSIYDASTTSTSSEIPMLPEFSSHSPEFVSEEESSPVPPSPSTSEESVHDYDHHETPVEVPQPQPEQPQPTDQPEEEQTNQHEHHNVSEEPSAAVSAELPESSTEADLPSESSEPVSNEHHHEEPEMISILSSSPATTSTTTEASLESVSEEVIEPGHHHEDHGHQPAIVPVETTTPAATSTSTTPTPEPLPILISSSEETQHEQSGEQDTTVHPRTPESSVEAQSKEIGSTELPVQPDDQSVGLTSSEEIGRVDFDESVHPTDPILPEVVQNSSVSENITIQETVKDTSSESTEEKVPEVVPTDAPANTEQESIGEPSISPPVDQVREDAHDDVNSVEATTAISDDDEVATTLIPHIDQEHETLHGQSHDITPLDVLRVSSTPAVSSTTPTPNFAHAHSDEKHQGRSVESSFETESSEVESFSEGNATSGEASQRSQNLTEEDNESATEINRNRAPRLFSTETGNQNQLLTEDDQAKSGEREDVIMPAVSTQNEEEPARPSQNVTESASVETADENPEMASAVTKTSSEEITPVDGGASREASTLAATLPMSNSENENSQSQSGSNESNNNDVSVSSGISSASRESGEISQESPVASQSESESGESTTFSPRSLHHDIDINYLGNNTEDLTNSEPVQVQPEVESVEDEHVTNQGMEKTSDKLVMAPQEEEPAATTVSPVPSPEELAGSQEETPETSASKESGERPEEIPATTTRGISATIFGSEESFESPNRDHRDTNADIETPFASRTSAEVQNEEIVTTTVPSVTSSSSTTTTTTVVPVPEVTLADLILTTTTTTTTTTPAPSSLVNDTKSDSLLSDNINDSFSQESSHSGSLEETSSSSHVQSSHEEVSPSSSPEEEKSASEPTFSASRETSGSLESRQDHGHLEHNELT